MLLTETQIQEIRRIIQDHHNAFVANVLGPNVVAAEILDRLKQKGLYVPKVESIRESYVYGQLLAILDDPKTATMGYEEFKRYIRTNPIPLSDLERQAVMLAQQQAGQYAVGLGNRVDQQTGQILIEADHALRHQLRSEIKTATAENIARRESVKQLKSDLGWATRDWSRDWDRIARTEKQNAFQHGLADNYAAKYGSDTLVAKRAMPDACPHCKRLHIGPDGQPRIFKLSTLVANGTNFKTKTADWKAVVGPIHPNCQCQMIRVPEGWGFNAEGQLVPGGKLGVLYEDDDELEASLKFEFDLEKALKLDKRLEFQGLKLRIENPAGSVRHWTDQQGRKGSTKLRYAYGYVEATEGQDGDEVDAFIGHYPRAPEVFVVHQQNPKTGQYDETKCFLGFQTKEDAERAYRQHYDRPDFKLWTDTLSIEGFKRWLGTLPQRRERFVMRKSDNLKLAPVVVAGSGVMTEGAMSAWRGTGVNYAVGSPPRGVPKSDPKELTPDVKELYWPDEDRVVPDSLKRDLEVYDMSSPPERVVRRFDLPEEWGEQFEKLRKEAKKNKAHTNREHNRLKAVVRNTVDPRDSAPVDLAKSRVPVRKEIVRTPVRSWSRQGVTT